MIKQIKYNRLPKIEKYLIAIFSDVTIIKHDIDENTLLWYKNGILICNQNTYYKRFKVSHNHIWKGLIEYENLFDSIVYILAKYLETHHDIIDYSVSWEYDRNLQTYLLKE